MRPIRPPQPTTPIRVPAMLASDFSYRRDGRPSPGKTQAGARRRRRARFSRPAFSSTRGGMGLFRAAATVGFYTLLSRVFGFARDILSAAILGAGPVADAFFVALRLPNLFRSLFAEGAFSAAFVPAFAGTVAESGAPEARIFAEDALAVLAA